MGPFKKTSTRGTPVQVRAQRRRWGVRRLLVYFYMSPLEERLPTSFYVDWLGAKSLTRIPRMHPLYRHRRVFPNNPKPIVKPYLWQ